MEPDNRDVRFLLGRIDGTLSEIKAAGEARDRRVEDLSRRLYANNNDANENAAVLSRSIDALGDGYHRIEDSLAALGTQVVTLNGRVEVLEAPVTRAKRAREERRRVVGRVIYLLVGAASFSWLFLQPLYQTVAESALRRWLGE